MLCVFDVYGDGGKELFFSGLMWLFNIFQLLFSSSAHYFLRIHSIARCADGGPQADDHPARAEVLGSQLSSILPSLPPNGPDAALLLPVRLRHVQSPQSRENVYS